MTRNICRICGEVYYSDEARLIAAAPDMLEALKCIMESNTAFPDVYMPKVRAAIAKATGEPEK